MSTEVVVERINDCLSSNKRNPLFVFIAGGSCAGKTTLAKRLNNYFTKSSVIPMDDYFLDIDDPDLPIENGRLSFDKPESYHLQELSEHLMLLNQHYSILSPVYNLSDNKRVDRKKRIPPTELIIVEGLYAIRLGHNLSITNKLSVFVNTPYHIRLQRRIDRDKDIAPEEVIEHFFRNRAEPLYQEYIFPQLKMADTVTYGF